MEDDSILLQLEETEKSEVPSQTTEVIIVATSDSGKENISEASGSAVEHQTTFQKRSVEEATIDDQLEPPVKKKKRGRPSKKDRQDLKPTRESQRAKKCPSVICYDEHKMRCLWSDKTKKQLLKGLEEFGSEDIEGLMRYLPNVAENEIKNQIRMWKDFARAELEKKLVTEKRKMDSATVNCITKLDDWISYFEEMGDMSQTKLSALYSVFLLIAEYGKFPPPSECNGIDFRGMYRYIHCMLNGLPYYNMNRATATMLGQSISDMAAMLRELTVVHQLQPQLYNMPKHIRPRCRSYGRPSMRVLSTSRNAETILNLSDINPLNLPPHLLTKPDLEKDDEEDDEDEDFMDK